MTAGLKGQKHKRPISVSGIGRTFEPPYYIIRFNLALRSRDPFGKEVW